MSYKIFKKGTKVLRGVSEIKKSTIKAVQRRSEIIDFLDKYGASTPRAIAGHLKRDVYDMQGDFARLRWEGVIERVPSHYRLTEGK